MKKEQIIKLVYDTDLKRPACVLLQAVMGGSTQLLNDLHFKGAWLIVPTPGMKLLAATRSQWEHVAKMQPTDGIIV